MRIGRQDLRQRLLPILLSQGFGLACGIAGLKLATRWVEPSHYGIYGIFLSLTPIGMWVVHAGLIKYVARNWASMHRPALWSVTSKAAWKKFPWLVLLAASGSFALGSPSVLFVFPFLLIAATALSFGTMAQTALQADRRHWADLAVNASGSVSRSFLPPILYMMSGAGLVALYFGFAIHSVILVSTALLALRPWQRDTSQTTVPALGSVYDGPLFTVLAVVGWIMAGINRWIMAGFHGAELTGYFTLGATVAGIVGSVLSAVAVQFVQPMLFALPHETAVERQELARHADRAAFVFWTINVAALLALRAIMPWLIGPLIDHRYAAAIEFVVPAGFFILAAATTFFYDVMLMTARREKACGPVDLTIAAVLVGGAVISGALGVTWFKGWLTASALLPWILSRPLARRYLLSP